jgi:hypothetical protein
MSRSLRTPDRTFARTHSSTTSLRDHKTLKSPAAVVEVEVKVLASAMAAIRTEISVKNLAPITLLTRMVSRSRLTKRVSL